MVGIQLLGRIFVWALLCYICWPEWRTELCIPYLIALCLSLECQNYQSLTDGTRQVTYRNNHYYCDNGLSGWYRFQGGAGTRMATSCPSTNQCGTSATGWLSGGHPSVADGQVSRLACFHWNSNCCLWSKYIKVRNCGAFYVYHIPGTPYGHCDLRYCSTF